MENVNKNAYQSAITMKKSEFEYNENINKYNGHLEGNLLHNKYSLKTV